MLRGHTAPVSAVAFGLDRKGLHVASFAVGDAAASSVPVAVAAAGGGQTDQQAGQPPSTTLGSSFRCWHPAAAAGHCLCTFPSAYVGDWHALELKWTASDTVTLYRAASTDCADAAASGHDKKEKVAAQTFVVPGMPTPAVAAAAVGSPRHTHTQPLDPATSPRLVTDGPRA